MESFLQLPSGCAFSNDRTLAEAVSYPREEFRSWLLTEVLIKAGAYMASNPAFPKLNLFVLTRSPFRHPVVLENVANWHLPSPAIVVGGWLGYSAIIFRSEIKGLMRF